MRKTRGASFANSPRPGSPASLQLNPTSSRPSGAVLLRSFSSEISLNAFRNLERTLLFLSRLPTVFSSSFSRQPSVSLCVSLNENVGFTSRHSSPFGRGSLADYEADDELRKHNTVLTAFKETPHSTTLFPRGLALYSPIHAHIAFGIFVLATRSFVFHRRRKRRWLEGRFVIRQRGAV